MAVLAFDLALIAEHQVVAGTGVDHVVAATAEDHVAQVTAGDRVDAAVAEIAVARCFDLADGEVMHRELDLAAIGLVAVVGSQLAAVAQGDVEAAAGVQRVVAEAPEHDVVAVAGLDVVVAAERGEHRPHTVDVVRARRVGGFGELDLFGQVVDQTMITEHDVVAVGRSRAAAAAERVDRVVAAAAEDHVAATAGGDRVVAIAELVGRAVQGARVDRGHASEHLHLVVVVSPGDARDVGVDHRRVRTRVHAKQPAMVAEDDVLAAARVDHIGTLPADDDVVRGLDADRRVCNEVALAESRQGVDAFDHVQSRDVGVCGSVVVGREVAHVALVAEDHIGTRAAVDRVDTVATEQAVAAGVALYVVVSAVGRLVGADVGNLAHDQDLLNVGNLLQHDAVVAEDDVVAVVALDRVLAHDQVVAVGFRVVVGRPGRIGCRHGQQAADDIDVDTRVAVDAVVAAVAEDRVVARAAGQHVTELAAADRVVAAAAIDHDAEPVGTEGTGGRCVGAGVDHVVAVLVERVGARHAVEDAALVRVRPEHQRVGHVGVVGPPCIPRSILRGVAVDHQRRGRPATAGDGDAVASDVAGVRTHHWCLHREVAACVDGREPAVRRAGVQRAGDQQRVVAGTHQQVEDLDVRSVGRAVRALLAVADAGGEVVRVAERGLVEMQHAGQVQAGQLRAGERAGLVFLARIVEHVEDVDRRAFGRLRRDDEHRRVGLARQHHGIDGQVHRTAETAFDLQRALDVRQQVRLHRELLGAGVDQVRRRVGHRCDRHHLRDPPVACRERLQHRLGRQPVVARRDRHRPGGCLRQPHRVGVGDAAVDQGAAVALQHQHAGRVVVGHGHGERLADGALAVREVGRVSAGAHAVRDRRDLLVFAQRVVERTDVDGLRDVPVGRREGQRRRRQSELAAHEAQRDGHVGRRCLGQLDGIRVGDAVHGTFEHQRAVVVGVVADFGQQDAGGVVVDHRHEHVAHLDAVVGRNRRGLVRRRCRSGIDHHRLNAVADRHGALAFLRAVVRSGDEHRHARVPVAGVEHQHDRAVALGLGLAVDDQVAHEVRVGRHEHGVAVVRAVLLFLRRTRGAHGHVDLGAGGRRDGQAHEVAVQRAPLAERGFAHQRRAVRFLDDHVAAEAAAAVAAGQAGDVEVDARGDQAVVADVSDRRDLVVDDRALAFQLLCGDEVGHVAGDVEQVVAQAAHDARGHAERRALDREMVVALEPVDFEHLDVGVAHVDTAAVHALVGDDEVVAELGAQHQHLVEAGTAVDRDRRIQAVLDEVVAGAAFERARRRSRAAALADGHAVGIGLDRAVGVGLGERERAHDERVVAVVAFEAQRGLVAVNLEHVVAAAACGHQRCTGAAAEVAAGGGDGAEHVGRRDARADVSLAAEDLADLECIVAGPAVERGDRAVVVDREVVVAAQGFDDQPAVQVGVVVDALDLARAGAGHRLHEAAVQQRHERRRLGRFARDRTHAAQQEDVVARTRHVGRGVHAGDEQLVHAVGLAAGVEHIDDVVVSVRPRGLASRGVDVVVVGIGLAVERQRVAGAVAVDVHRLQLVHDESVFAVVGKNRAVVLAAEHGGVGVEPGLVEGEGVDVGVAEDFGEGLVGVAVGHGHGGRRVDVADRAAQVHLRAAARVGVGVVDVVGFAQAPRVAANRDAVTGQATRDDAAVRIRGDVVADPQHRRREGADLSQRHQRGRALAHARAAAGQQHQVLGVGRTGVGHRQAQLASECARCQHVQFAVDFGDEHVLRGLREQAAAGAGVDVEVVAVDADAAATRVEVDVRGEHVDGVAHAQVGVGERVRSAIGVEVVVSVDDGARTGHQRHVTCGRRDVMNAQGAQRFLDEDTARRVGFQHAALRHVAHRVEQVGFEEIPGRTNACGDRFQRDVDAGHVRFGVGKRIDDGCRRSQRHVVRVRRDAAHAHVAGLLGQRDEAVGQHVDVAAVDDLGDAGHVHLRRARCRVERVDDDVAGGRAGARGDEARAAVQRVDEVVGALDRHARHRAAEEADIDAAAVGPAIGVVAREVRYRPDRGRAGAGMHAHAARRAGAGFENRRLQDQVGVAAAGQAGSHQVDVEDMRVGVDVARIAELRRRVAQAALEVDEVVGAGLRHEADAVGDRQRGTALGDAVRALLEVRGVDRDRDVVVSVVERRGQADAQVIEADHVVGPAVGEAAECRCGRARVVDD